MLVSQNIEIKAGKISVVFFLEGFHFDFSLESDSLMNEEMQSETWERECVSQHVRLLVMGALSSQSFLSALTVCEMSPFYYRKHGPYLERNLLEN